MRNFSAVGSVDAELHERLRRIEESINQLVNRKVEQDFFSVQEIAKILDKSNFTIREWCRLGRVHGEKKLSGRGRAQEWVISKQELTRIQREGLLPR